MSARLREWHEWYTWHPALVYDYGHWHIVWLKKIERCVITKPGGGEIRPHIITHYRLMGGDAK